MRVERIHLDAGGFEEFFAGLAESKPLRTDRVVFTDGDRALSIVGDGPVTIEAIETRSDGGNQNQNQNQNISRLREALKQIRIVREKIESDEEVLAEFLERNVEESVDYAAEFLERKSEDEETIVTDGGVGEEEKPSPPVPPTQIDHIPNAGKKRILNREAVGRCDCGGTIYEETIATGDLNVGRWDEDDFDPSEWKLEAEWDETTNRVECDFCGAGYSY